MTVEARRIFTCGDLPVSKVAKVDEQITPGMVSAILKEAVGDVCASLPPMAEVCKYKLDIGIGSNGKMLRFRPWRGVRHICNDSGCFFVLEAFDVKDSIIRTGLSAVFHDPKYTFAHPPVFAFLDESNVIPEPIRAVSKLSKRELLNLQAQIFSENDVQ